MVRNLILGHKFSFCKEYTENQTLGRHIDSNDFHILNTRYLSFCSLHESQAMEINKGVLFLFWFVCVCVCALIFSDCAISTAKKYLHYTYK